MKNAETLLKKLVGLHLYPPDPNPLKRTELFCTIELTLDLISFYLICRISRSKAPRIMPHCSQQQICPTMINQKINSSCRIQQRRSACACPIYNFRSLFDVTGFFFSNLHIFMIYIYTYIQNIYRQQFIGQKKSETKRETQNLNTKQKMIYTHIYMYIKLYIYIYI